MSVRRNPTTKARKRRARSVAPKADQLLLGTYIRRKTSTAPHQRQSDRAAADDDSGAGVPSAFIDEVETSKQLKLAVSTLQNWKVIGRGPPFFRFGRLIRYSPEENARWAQSRRVRSTSDIVEVERVS